MWTGTGFEDPKYSQDEDDLRFWALILITSI